MQNHNNLDSTVRQNNKGTLNPNLPQPHVSVPICLGQMMLLAMESPLHKDVPLHALKTMLLPAILKGQFKIFHFDGKLAGFTTWAYLSDQIFDKYLNNRMTLDAEDWDSGDRVWIMEIVAPFGHHAMIVNELGSIFDPTNCFMLMYEDNHHQKVYALVDLLDQIQKQQTRI